MATYRLSIFFLSADDEGWTENYYLNASSLPAAATQLDLMMNTRAPLMCNKFKMVDGRASDVTVRGNVQFTSNTLPVVGTYALPTGKTALEANTALVCRFSATPPRFALVYLRGLSSAQIAGREKVVESVWDSSFSTWHNFVSAGTFQARHRVTPPPHATYSYSTITAYSGNIVSARKPGRPFGLLVGRRT